MSLTLISSTLTRTSVDLVVANRYGVGFVGCLVSEIVK